MPAPTVTCPTCQAVLRLPAGADMVRCPRCKTVLTVAGPEPEPAPPPPPPVRPAVPLPFGRPLATATPAAPAEPVPVEPEPEAKKTAKLVQDDDPAEAAAREAKREAQRRATAEREKEERRLARLATQCGPAQQGITVLGWAAGIYAVALGLSFLYAVCYVLNLYLLMTPLLYLAALLGAVNWVLSVGGLGLCVYGPKPVRPMAASALIFALAHAALFVLQVITNLARFGTSASADEQETLKVLTSFDVLGAVSNLNVLTDFPGNIIAGIKPAWVGTAGGILELTRLVMIGILCQHYAHEGKERELGYSSLQFIVRIFVLIVLVTVLKMILKGFLTTPALDPGMQKFLAAAVSMSSAGLFLTMALIVYVQCRVLLETAEVIDPRRFGPNMYMEDKY